MKSTRSVLLGTILLEALIGCGDAATAPVPRLLHVSAFVGGDPPPPPADGIGSHEGNNFFCSTADGTVLEIPMPVSTNVKARILFNPPQTYAAIDFSSGGANVEVSNDARIRIIRDLITTSGSVLIPFKRALGPEEGSIPEIIWDLPSVTVSFADLPSAKSVTLVAPVYYPGRLPVFDDFQCADGTVQVLLYRFGAITYDFPKSH